MRRQQQRDSAEPGPCPGRSAGTCRARACTRGAAGNGSTGTGSFAGSTTARAASISGLEPESAGTVRTRCFQRCAGASTATG